MCNYVIVHLSKNQSVIQGFEGSRSRGIEGHKVTRSEAEALTIGAQFLRKKIWGQKKNLGSNVDY